MARPRSVEVVERLMECRIHGMVMKRRHKHVVTNGLQRYLWRCCACHTEKVQSIQVRKAS